MVPAASLGISPSTSSSSAVAWSATAPTGTWAPSTLARMRASLSSIARCRTGQLIDGQDKVLLQRTQYSTGE